MSGNTSMIVKNLYVVLVVLHFHMQALIAIWNAIVVAVFAKIDMAGLLNLSPSILTQVIAATGQRLQPLSFCVDKLLATSCAAMCKQVVVVLLQ